MRTQRTKERLRKQRERQSEYRKKMKAERRPSRDDLARVLLHVVETKSSLFTVDLGDKESAKIECGKVHYKTLEVRDTPARYVMARTIDDMIA